jgi:hypothetical protein
VYYFPEMDTDGSEGSRAVAETPALPPLAPSRAPVSDTPITSIFSPELDLILACCGADSNEQPSARNHEALRHPLDWDRLLRLAEHHGLVPLLYRRLSVAMEPTQSAGLEAFRQRDKFNAHRTLWLTVELIHIHKHLAARGLDVLPYKGPVLAESLYGNVATRQFSDLDLLVRAQDVVAVRSALSELAYEPGLHLTPSAERAYLKSGYEYAFDGPKGRNLVEVKWQILPRFYSIGFEVEGFFERAIAANVAGHKLRTLSDQDLMLVLCVHAAKHAWIQISWLCDIAQLSRSKTIDWDVLRAQASRLGIARMVAVTFLLAHKLLGTALPNQLELRDDPAAEKLAEEILRQIVAEVEIDTESAGYFRLMMKLRERRRDRTSFLWWLLVTPSAGEWSAIRLPSVLFPLYRVVRMFRLAGRMVSSKSKT